jgi:hypothetical protein
VLVSTLADSNVVDLMLGRVEAAAYIRQSLGIPITANDLERGGPAYRKFGARVLYRRGDVLAWAQQRLSPPIVPQHRKATR